MSIAQFIFTDLPHGKGLDPNSRGFQIKEISGGLDKEIIEQLETISMHYGQAVYNAAPQHAVERETGWRSTTQSIEVVPQEVLEAFPPILSYTHLRDDRYALTRTTYVGTTHDRRFGNFLSHALVLTPDDLRGHHGNPLAVAKQSLFLSHGLQDMPIIPDQSALGISSPSDMVFSILRERPFSAQAAEMCAALCDATPTSRPLLICLNDWRQGPVLIEALLCLLPASARARTTFCTYESDRTWVPAKSGARPQGQAAAHHIVLQCSTDANPVQLRPDEYQRNFAVFNFTANQFSTASVPTPFSHYVAQCINSDNAAELFVLLEHIESIGRGSDLETWDMFAQLLIDQNSQQALEETIL